MAVICTYTVDVVVPGAPAQAQENLRPRLRNETAKQRLTESTQLKIRVSVYDNGEKRFEVVQQDGVDPTGSEAWIDGEFGLG